MKAVKIMLISLCLIGVTSQAHAIIAILAAIEKKIQQDMRYSEPPKVTVNREYIQVKDFVTYTDPVTGEPKNAECVCENCNIELPDVACVYSTPTGR